MSKRHKKSKLTFSADGDADDMRHAFSDYDLSGFDVPKGKKRKGRNRRASHKRAYYDD